MLTITALVLAMALPPILHSQEYNAPKNTPEMLINWPAYKPSIPPKPQLKDNHRSRCGNRKTADTKGCPLRRGSKQTECAFDLDRKVRAWEGEVIRVEKIYRDQWYLDQQAQLAYGYFAWIETYTRMRS